MDSEARPTEAAFAVVVDVPAISHALDYLAPAGKSEGLINGTIVRVPLHGRKVNGWVVGRGSSVDIPLQRISKIKGFGPPESVLEVARFVAWRYCGPVQKFLRAASPDRNVARLLDAPPAHVLEVPSPTITLPNADHNRANVVTLGATEDPFPLVLHVVNEAVLAKRRGSVLIATPTVAYAERLTARLERLGIAVAGPGPEQWVRARSGWPVVVGARGIAFAPVDHVAGVVVLDAHERGFQEEGAPTWSAVTVLEERAKRDRAPCWLVTPLPIPTLSVGRSEGTARGTREADAWPRVEVVDLTTTDPRHRLLTEPFIDQVRDALASSSAPGTVVCLFHRTGRAKLLACRSCTSLVTCASCGATMSEDGTLLTCQGCRETRPLLCSRCGGMSLKVVRPGVGRLAEELRALFHCDVDEVTAATGNQPLSAQLVIGTEAVLHRVRRSALVVILDLDQYLLAPQMRAEEATLEMLVRSARLVGGRGEDRGTLLVQTRQPDHEVVRALVAGDPSEALRTLTERRRRLNQPPFAAYARLRGSDASTYGEEVSAASTVNFVDLGEEKGVLIGENHEALCDALRRTPRDRRNVIIAVDPEDL